MKINKMNYDLYKQIDIAKITRFAGDGGVIPENKGQTFYNVELANDNQKVVIPLDITEKVKNLDIECISDQINFDNV